MNMSVDMIEKVYDMDVTIIATRYCTPETPDIIFWLDSGAYRATWSTGEKMGWVCAVADREIENVLPDSQTMMDNYLETY